MEGGHDAASSNLHKLQIAHQREAGLQEKSHGMPRVAGCRGGREATIVREDLAPSWQSPTFMILGHNTSLLGEQAVLEQDCLLVQFTPHKATAMQVPHSIIPSFGGDCL